MSATELKEAWKKRLQDMAGKKGYVTVRQMAQVLDISQHKVYYEIRFDRLEIVRMGENGGIRILLDSAIEYIDQLYVQDKKKRKRPPVMIIEKARKITRPRYIDPNQKSLFN